MRRIHKIGKSSTWKIFFVAALLLASFSIFAESKTVDVKLVANARKNWVDIYVVNEGPGEVSERFRPDHFYIGTGVYFIFFDKHGSCLKCEYLDTDDADSVPTMISRGLIAPGESSGASFLAREIIGLYQLSADTCYGFFVVLEEFPFKKSTPRVVSNVQSICVNESRTQWRVFDKF
jgi:hypothetical protein